MRRAQASLEFLMLIGLMTAVFVVFYAVIAGFFVEFHEKENTKIAYDLLRLVEKEIMFANNGFDGYQRIFLLPSSLDGDPYKIRIIHPADRPVEEIQVAFRDKEYGIPILPRVYLTKPGDGISGDEVNVTRSEGRITIASIRFDEVTS